MSPELLQTKMNIVDLDGDLGSKKKIAVKNWVDNPEAQEGFRKVMSLCSDFRKVAQSHLSDDNLTVAKSWKLLWYHTEFCSRYASILLAHSLGDTDKAQNLLSELVDAFSKIELEISTEFDLFLFNNSVKRKFN